LAFYETFENEVVYLVWAFIVWENVCRFSL